MATELGNRPKDVGGFLSNFGADAVAGENCNFETHGVFPQGAEAPFCSDFQGVANVLP